MIQLIDGLPDNVVGAEASGKVSSDDYETVLMPAVQKAIDSSGKTRVLFVLGEDFDGYEAGAALDDARMGMRDWNSFEKMALVTDHNVYRDLVKAFGFLMPGEVRVYPLAERDKATSWVSG